MKVYGLVRFVKDLELQHAGDKAILKTTVAWNDKKKEGHFHKVVFWNKNAENVVRFFKKGDKIFIKSADLSNNNYQGKEGMVYQNLITVFEWEFVEQTKDAKPTHGIEHPAKTKEQQEYESIEIDLEQLPF